MPKWVKNAIAILLLPVCVGAGKATFRVLRATGHADTVWVAILGGAACWYVIYVMLPKPMRVYVFGHELTHAIWAWVFGGKVKRFKATAKGGHVILTKTNFVITLAPYFFPIYVVMIVLAFAMGHLLWGLTAYFPGFHFLVGAAYAFHVTLTWHILQTRQPDITQQGCLFSAVIIWLGNVGVLLLGVPLLTERIDVWTALGWFWVETGQVWQRLGQLL
ncbi:MAG: hypothetical protein AAB466_13360 [Verrucomicrobiota bacterium]